MTTSNTTSSKRVKRLRISNLYSPDFSYSSECRSKLVECYATLLNIPIAPLSSDKINFELKAVKIIIAEIYGLKITGVSAFNNDMIVTTKTTKDKALHEKCIILLLAGPVLEHMFSGVVKNEINCLAKAVNMLGRADEKTTRKQLEYLWNMTFNEIYGNINAVKFFADKLRRSEYIPPKLVKSILTNLKYA